MEVVVKVSDEKYKAIQKRFETGCALSATDMAILNGTILPKGHGRLKDVDAFIKAECSKCDGYCDVCNCDCLNCKSEYRCECIQDIDSADVIIEADKEVDNADID